MRQPGGLPGLNHVGTGRWLDTGTRPQNHVMPGRPRPLSLLASRGGLLHTCHAEPAPIPVGARYLKSSVKSTVFLEHEFRFLSSLGMTRVAASVMESRKGWSTRERAGWRRGRDSNPRETVKPLRDFQSRPFGRSGTSPSQRQLYSMPLSPVHQAGHSIIETYLLVSSEDRLMKHSPLSEGFWAV